jgi:DNA polymerase-3 subunit delta
MKLTAGKVAQFISEPDTKSYQAFLLYGPEAGLVSERVFSLTKNILAEEAGEIVRFHDNDLAETPDCIAIEARTIPMFGGRNIIKIAAGVKLQVKAIAELIDDSISAIIVVEAGNLKPSSPLRKAFESSTRAVALPCYADVIRDTNSLINEVSEASGILIRSEVKEYLASFLGSDLAQSRKELDKLFLYAHNHPEITTVDIDTIVGDATDMSLDIIVNAVADGRQSTAIKNYQKLVASGQSSAGVYVMLARHFQRLHSIVSQGTSPEAAVKYLRPPLNFKQRDMFLRQCRRWSAGELAVAIMMIQEATLKSRMRPEIENITTERLIMALARTVS